MGLKVCSCGYQPTWPHCSSSHGIVVAPFNTCRAPQLCHTAYIRETSSPIPPTLAGVTPLEGIRRLPNHCPPSSPHSCRRQAPTCPAACPTREPSSFWTRSSWIRCSSESSCMPGRDESPIFFRGNSSMVWIHLSASARAYAWQLHVWPAPSSTLPGSCMNHSLSTLAGPCTTARRSSGACCRTC